MTVTMIDNPSIKVCNNIVGRYVYSLIVSFIKQINSNLNAFRGKVTYYYCRTRATIVIYKKIVGMFYVC